MQKIQNHKASILSMLGMMGIAACIAFAIEPTLDTELNDIPGDTHLGEWVQAISSNQVSESVYATNGNLVVNGMEYPVGGGGGSEEEIVALSNRVNAIENAGYIATNDIGWVETDDQITFKKINVAASLIVGAGDHGSLEIIGATTNYGPLVVKDFVGGDGGIIVNGTNVMERIDEIASSGGDLTPATNYVDAATNNLRAKTDMAVYDGFAPWTMRMLDITEWQFVWNAALGGWYYSDSEQLLKYESGYWNLLYTGEEPHLPISDPVAGTGNELRVVFIATGQIFTRTEIVAPSDDRLATTSGVAVAIASAVPAGVVTTNDNGEIGANLSLAGGLSVAGGITTGGMTVYGSALVDGGDFVVGGMNMTDAIIATSNAIPAEIGLAISTNNPAFVAAVTNIIQNLPQDTLQALKAALNAIP